jgi:hypothetical protein
MQRAFREMENVYSTALGKLKSAKGEEPTQQVAPPAPAWTSLVERVLTELTATGKASERQRYMAWHEALRTVLVRTEYQIVIDDERIMGWRLLVQLMCHSLVGSVARYKCWIVLCHLLRQGKLEWSHSEETKYALSLYAVWESTGLLLQLIVPQEPSGVPAQWPHWRKLTPKEWLTGDFIKFWEAIGQHQAAATPSARLGMDPYEAGEVPSCLYSIEWSGKKGVTTRCICTPPPIWQEISGGTRLAAPEFRAFLQMADAWEEPHLTIRHASGRQRDPLDELDQEFTHFHQMQLPRDGDWAQQTGDYADLSEAAAWKKQFLKQIKDPKGSYLFPRALAPQINEWTSQLLDLLHAEFFGDRKSLAHPERRQFIELTNLHLVQYALTTLQPTSWNAMGRTRLNGGQLTHMLCCLLNLVLLGKGSDPSWGDPLEALTWGPYLESEIAIPSKDEVELASTVGQMLIAHQKTLPALWKKLSKVAPQELKAIELTWV